MASIKLSSWPRKSPHAPEADNRHKHNSKLNFLHSGLAMWTERRTEFSSGNGTPDCFLLLNFPVVIYPIAGWAQIRIGRIINCRDDVSYAAWVIGEISLPGQCLINTKFYLRAILSSGPTAEALPVLYEM